jgi:hypothetical protein
VIRVTVEMVPKGDESKAFTLAQGIIANDGTGDLETGNYVYGFSAQVTKKNPEPEIKTSGRLTGFKRLRDDVWVLINRCLTEGDQELVTPDGKEYRNDQEG